MRCAICLRTFTHPLFNSSRITICGTCVNALNTYRTVAEEGYRALAEKLRFAIRRRALEEADDSTDVWRARRGRHTLDTLDQTCAEALPRWIKTAAADARWTTRPNKLIRAHRRGLLHYDGPNTRPHPNNWPVIASRIRLLDRFKCVRCGAQNVELHVHHIVYASNFGTHRKTNLVTLCRPCHEKEHGRALDFGEHKDGLTAPESTTTPAVEQSAWAQETDSSTDWGVEPLHAPSPQIPQRALAPTDFGGDWGVAPLQAASPQISQPSAAVTVAANHPIAREPVAPAMGSPEQQGVAPRGDVSQGDVWPWVAITLSVILVLVALCL